MRWLATILLVLCVSLLWAVPVAATNITVTTDPAYATAAPNVTASNATGITAITAILHGNVTDDKGGHVTLRGFEWGLATGNYTWSWNETGIFGEGAFQHTIEGLNVDTQYFWRAFAENSIGRGNSTELSFFTSGISLPPTNFNVVQSGGSSVSITWAKGNGANHTIIRASDDNYPATVNDGYLVYNGTGTTVTDTGLSFEFKTYYYRAWSWNDNGYSTDHAQDSIGGGTMTLFALFALCGIVSFVSLRSRFYLFKLLAGASWISLFVYWMYAPPPSIGTGSPPHVAVMVVVFGLAIAIPIMGLGREIDTQKDWRGALTSQKSGFFKFKMPDWMRSGEEVTKEKRTQNVEEYRDKIRKAIRPSKRSKE